jgi:nucleotide-binding universal stress UspA family protein
MFTIAKILVPFDGSDTSRAAVSLALQLAHIHSSQLHMLTVQARLDKVMKKRLVTAPHGTAVERAIRDREGKLEAAVRLELERARDAGQTWSHPTLFTHVSGGSWKVVVRNLVEEHEIDTIIVGTHGRQGLLEAFWGTDTEEWVRRSPCSVLVVKPQGYPYLRD